MMMSAMKSQLLVLMPLLLVALSSGNTPLFPCGPGIVGDTLLDLGDEPFTRVNLTMPFRFFGNDKTTLWFASDGYLSDTAGEQGAQLFIDLFFQEQEGQVGGEQALYRETDNSEDIQLATSYVRELFPDQPNFQATSLVIFTWDRFRASQDTGDGTLTGQVVLVRSNTINVVLLVYDAVGVNFNGQIGVIGPMNTKQLCVSFLPNSREVDTSRQATTCGVFGFIVETGQNGDCVPVTVNPPACLHDSIARCPRLFCPPDACANGGTCSEVTGGFMCQCSHGFTGTTCEINIDDCAENPCGPAGTCVDGINTFSCNCAPGFDGQPCMDIDECAGFPCGDAGEGTCVDGINTFTCNCATGYEGVPCEDINECDMDPPLCPGKECINTLGSYFCFCPSQG